MMLNIFFNCYDAQYTNVTQKRKKKLKWLPIWPFGVFELNLITTLTFDIHGTHIQTNATV